MNGIIADVCFDLTFIEEGEGEGYYFSNMTGYLEELSQSLDLEKADFVAFSKVGNDDEGETIKACYENIDLECAMSTIYSTAISINQNKRYRYSALYDIKEDEVKSFIFAFNINTLFISASLLSFKPVSREIVNAVIKMKEKLSYVIVDTSLSYDILLLEELKECIERMRDEGVNLYIVGEALDVEGVKGMSSLRRDEILSFFDK